MASEYAESAAILAEAQKWRYTYIMAGHSLECALKLRIIHHHGLKAWPSRTERPEFHVYDLSRLACFAGLAARLEGEVDQGTKIGMSWHVAKDFAVNRRYTEGAAFPAFIGRDMVDAVVGPGLLKWLTVR